MIARKQPMDLDTLAQLMVEGFEDVKSELRAEFRNEIGHLREEMHEGFRRIDAELLRINTELEKMNSDIYAIRHDIADINRRLERLEERAESNAGFAKEIDELRARVGVLEKKLNAECSH